MPQWVDFPVIFCSCSSSYASYTFFYERILSQNKIYYQKSISFLRVIVRDFLLLLIPQQARAFSGGGSPVVAEEEWQATRQFSNAWESDNASRLRKQCVEPSVPRCSLLKLKLNCCSLQLPGVVLHSTESWHVRSAKFKWSHFIRQSSLTEIRLPRALAESAWIRAKPYEGAVAKMVQFSSEDK